MSPVRQRLALRVFHLLEGEAEGAFAVLAFLVVVLAVVAMAICCLGGWPR